MAKEFIAAIELGSSKLTGIAGKRNLDGSITILAVVQESSSSYIRRGVIYNIDKTMLALTNIKKRLENLLQTKIRQVYVGVGGQSIVGIKNVIVRDLPPATTITQQMVNELMDSNRNMNYPDKQILDAISLEYSVDSQLQTDPVGIQCSRLEGNFLNILWRKQFFKNLNQCFESAGIAIADMYLAPLTLADSVLAEAERRAGCVLVDLGAETTTVSVYYKNILRHLVVLPLGGENVTRDIMSLQMEEAEAEKMKLKYGSAYTRDEDIDDNASYPIGMDRTVESCKFIELVEARVEEIIENVWFQVPAEYANKLFGGIILTGGMAGMKNIDEAFRKHTRIEKVRISKCVNQTVDATQPEVTAQDCRMNTVISLLAKGDMNCAGDPLNSKLFDGGSEASGTPGGGPRSARDPKDIQGTGIVQTEKQIDDLTSQCSQLTDAIEKGIANDANEKRRTEKSPWNKLVKVSKNFVNKAISDEE